jgi:NifU-like protein
VFNNPQIKEDLVMWDYTDKVKDHFQHPRNVGKIEDPSGEGQVGSLACGDALKLMINVDENEIITDAKFQTFGCASAIASASALTEMIIGMSVDDAEKVTNQDIADFLAGLPKAKMHCSVMGREALEAAIYNYRTGKTLNKELEGNVICHCFGVTDVEIKRVVKENKLSTVEEITEFTKAGGACGNCLDEIQAVLDQIAGEKVTVSAPPTKMTTIQKIRLIEDVIERQVRPILQRDGGNLELIDVDGDKVIVKFRGACSSCPASGVTLKNVVQTTLQEAVSEDITVEEA